PLDPQLRVKGVTGLRVVDGSVMPQLVAVNPNITTMLIGERAAELILDAQSACAAPVAARWPRICPTGDHGGAMPLVRPVPRRDRPGARRALLGCPGGAVHFQP